MNSSREPCITGIIALCCSFIFTLTVFFYKLVSRSEQRLKLNCTFSKVLRPEKLAPQLFEVDEDVEKDEVSPSVTNFLSEHSLSFCTCWSDAHLWM